MVKDMKGHSSSVKRKRRSESIKELQKKKRKCLDDFFVESLSAETILSRFQSHKKNLSGPDLALSQLKALTKVVKQLKEQSLHERVAIDDVVQVVNVLSNYIKDGYVKGLQTNVTEKDDAKWEMNAEVTFEACLICLYLFSSDNVLASGELDQHINDIVFFLRKALDEMNTQSAKKATSKPHHFKDILIQNLIAVSDLIKLRNFNTLNLIGLITTFIQTVLYQTDLDTQVAALSAMLSFYRKDEEFRALILNIVFKTIGCVHEAYRFSRNFPIHSSLNISMVTVLFMSLVENVPVLGFCTYVTSPQNSQSLLRESFGNVMRVACFLVATFIKNIGENTEGHRVYNRFLWHIVTELVEVCNEPEWPSARLILNLLLRPFTEILTLKNPVPSHLRVVGIKILTEVIKKKIRDKDLYSTVLDKLQLRSEPDFEKFTRQLLILNLSKSQHTDFNSGCTLLHAIQWFDNIRHEPNFHEKMSQLVSLFTDHDSDADMSDMEKRAVVYYLDTTRRSHADSETLLKYVLCCCNDKSKKISLLAAQSLFDLTTLDVDLLSRSVVSKIVNHSLLVSAPIVKERMCSIVDRYLMTHPDKSEEYAPFLARLLDEPSGGIKRLCIDIISRLVRSGRCRTPLCYKVLCLVQDEDPAVQHHVVEFFTRLWFNGADNVDTLLDLVAMPNGRKHLRQVLEDTLKPRDVPITWDTQSQPVTQIADATRELISVVLEKLERNTRTLDCLRALSVFVAVRPKAFACDVSRIAAPLRRPEYTRNFAVEILAAEILNFIIPEALAPDVLEYVVLRNELIDKLKSPASLSYTMGLTVSLLKLIANLSKFDQSFLFETCFQPSVSILRNCSPEDDVNHVKRAICIAVYFHRHFPDDLGFSQELLKRFITDPSYDLHTMHSLCYLSMDDKSVVKNDVIAETIRRQLRDPRRPLIVTAALYYILSTLKNISNGRLINGRGSEEDMSAVRSFLEWNIRDVLDCTINENVKIREISYSVVRQIIHSGTVVDARLAPSVHLMSTDPVESLANVGLELLKRLRGPKLVDLCKNASKCMVASLVFNRKCLKRDYIRGYRTRERGVEAVCNGMYVLHQEDVSCRRRIIDSVVAALGPEAGTSQVEKLFLADHLVSFGYKYQEEVFYVLSQMEAVRGVAPEPMRPTREYVDKHYGAYILSHVRTALMMHYRFSDDKMMKYYQEDGKKDLVAIRGPVTCPIPATALPGGSSVEDLARDIYDELTRSVTLAQHSKAVKQ